ncbi:hypothetical protein [Amycolatopsis sp. WGS_07]|uniref:hypothetical protein n=1 Tax=Amycolatopsis sp. WGS_07 TaxID=3076764 RepID=UPI00387325BB
MSTAFDLDPQVRGSNWAEFLRTGSAALPAMTPFVTESGMCSATDGYGCDQSLCHCETHQGCGPTFSCTTQTCDGTTGQPCAC